MGVSLLALLLYLLTAAHDLITGDTPEYLVAAKTLGVVHAPGYPLVTFLGYLFSWLPIGTVAFRIGLLAVVCSTATVAIVYTTVWRLTHLRVPAAAAALALATTPLFWKWSLQIETFPLNNLLVALTILLLIYWHQDPSRRAFLIAAAFTFGLALSNQETSALLIPAILWLLWLHRSRVVRARRTIGYATLALLAGAFPYIYVPLAALGHSPTNWDYVHSFSAFMRLLLRKDYGGITSQDWGRDREQSDYPNFVSGQGLWCPGRSLCRARSHLRLSAVSLVLLVCAPRSGLHRYRIHVRDQP